MEISMTIASIKELVRQTLKTPRLAATRLLALRLPPEWLWMALLLMTVLNAIVYSVSQILLPMPDPQAMAMMPAAFKSPVLFTIFLGGSLVISVFVMTWIGRALDGKALINDILVLICWLQVMRLGLQVIVLILMLAAPVLGGLLVMVASVWGIVILVAFLDVAHDFKNVGRAIMVMVLAVAAMVVGLSVILGVISVVILGAG